MSFKSKHFIKKESDDSDDVIFIKQEIDLTQMPSSTDYETSVTHVSKSKYLFNYKIKSIPSKLTLFFNKTNKIQVDSLIYFISV